MPDPKPPRTDDMSNCPCAGGTLDKLIQPAILIILSECGMHGYALVGRLSEMPMFAGDKPDPSGVYRLLKAMEGRGIVTSSWDTSQGGPAKRTYEITNPGRACLRAWINTLEGYRDAINLLLRAARSATET